MCHLIEKLYFLLEQTKPQDEFDHLDEDWHDVVGEPGGFLFSIFFQQR